MPNSALNRVQSMNILMLRAVVCLGWMHLVIVLSAAELDKSELAAQRETR